MTAEERILENSETSQLVSVQIMNKTINRAKKKKKKSTAFFVTNRWSYNSLEEITYHFGTTFGYILKS